MLRVHDFWQEEKDSPLLRLNYSFLPCEQVMKQIDDDVDDDSPKNLQHERIIRLDAERTFLGLRQREILMNVLSFLRQEFNSYHQAMSYVAGFLLLTRKPSKVIELMRQLHEKVLVGYWTSEPVAFATDAYVFYHILKDKDPELHQCLEKYHILPETFLQKWFTTLCIGVLPMEALFLFFDKFLIESLQSSTNLYLFQMGLSLMKHIRLGILGANNVATIYSYLRLDASLKLFDGDKKNLALDIVRLADQFDLTEYDFKKLREQLFDEKLKTRLESANRVHQLAANSSSDEDETDSDDETSQDMENIVSMIKQLQIE